MSDSCSMSLNEGFPIGGIKAWMVCLSAGLFFFYEFFQLNLFDVINQSLRNEFQIDARQLSWMSSAYVWANILFLLPAGVILDRYSVRRVILTAMMVCVLGTLGFGLSHTFWGASFFHFLTGIGNAFCFLSCIVLVVRWFPSRRQALVIGCIVTMAFIGGLAAHTPLAYLNDQLGWRKALMLDAGAGCLLWFVLWGSLKDHPGKKRLLNVVTHDPLIPAFKAALHNPQNWLCGLYTSCLNLPIMVFGALWGASYLMTVHKLPLFSASQVVSWLFIGSIVGCPLIGWISDAMGRRKLPMIIGAVFSLVVFSPLFFKIMLSETMLSVIFFLIGFVTSAQVISYPFIAESNRIANTGAATGIASVIVMGGGGLGQVIFGQLMQFHAGALSQHYQAVDFQYALWMFPVSVVIALLALTLTQETNCNRLE